GRRWRGLWRLLRRPWGKGGSRLGRCFVFVGWGGEIFFVLRAPVSGAVVSWWFNSPLGGAASWEKPGMSRAPWGGVGGWGGWRAAGLVGCCLAAQPGPSGLAGAGAADAPARAGLPPELSLVPPDAAGFISVRPAALLDSDIGKDLRPLLARNLPPDTKKILEQTDLTLADLERITVVVPAGKPTWNFVVTAGKPLPRAKLVGLVPGAKEV